MKTEILFKTPLTQEQQANSDLNLSEFHEGRPILNSAPRRIVFELTNRCNFNCIMCGREAVNFKTNDLSFEMLKACEPFFTKTEEITLHGWGEGTLHPKLGAILEYLNTFPKLRKYFVTNGSTLPKIMEHVFAHHVDLIAVSLDGATPETNNYIRKGGNFVREVANVKRLMAEKAARGLDYPYVNFVFTAMARNIHELPAMVELTRETGVAELKVVYLTIFEHALAQESILDKQDIVRRYFREAADLAQKYGIKLKLPEIQGEGDAGEARHKPCAFPWRDLYIGSDCFVRPCQSSADKLFDIRSYASPAEAWNSPEMQAMRQSVNSDGLMPAGCSNCYHSSCANWNLASSFVQLGKEFAPQWNPRESVEKSVKGA
ncbi:MAG: hypothetical protein A2054_03880 [Deltaproteobacteria bacterium GWA2_55_10]|nr:MAG: hypothetical protein A2054_03880 [Deltaproteobacteria bacterium GWA2_55_10]